MTGCIFKRKLSAGIAWGYSFFAGRDENGKRLQSFKSGFPTKGAAETACKNAIEEHERSHGRISRETGTRNRRVWAITLGELSQSGFTTREAAEIALQAAIDKRAADQVRRQDETRTDCELTFAKYFQLWIDEHAARRCAPKTLERYKELGLYLIREIGATPLNKLMTSQIQKSVHNLEDHGGSKTKEHPTGRPLSAKTVRHLGTLLYTALAEADRLGFLKIPHPMANKRVKLPKLQKRKPAVLDPEKLGTLFERARGTRLYPFVVLAADTGCRRGELLALTWPDLDIATGELTVSKSVEQTRAGLRVKSTKSGEARTIGISDWAIEVVAQHRIEQALDRELFGPDYEKHDLVFCQPAGGYYSPDRLGARVVELMRKAGLEGVSLHSLRHSYASIAISNGVPIPAVSERLGHADQNITLSIYSHALPADKRAASKVWSNAMADVIAASRKPENPRMLANVCRKPPAKKLSGSFKRKRVGGDDGARTRDLRRDRPAF
jgi:integrase